MRNWRSPARPPTIISLELMRVQVSARFKSDDELIQDLVRVAALDNARSLTRARYDQLGAFHSTTIARRFGTWPAALQEAGLSPGRSDLGHSDDVWMRNIYEMWVSKGRQPSYGDMRSSASRFTPEGYAHRYGSWTKALLRFQVWLDSGNDDGVQLKQDDKRTPRTSPKGRTPSLRLRWKVLERDRFTCQGCGSSPSMTPGIVLHVDHIVPFSRGGETTYSNLQTLCDRCNLGKTNALPNSTGN